MEKTLRLVIAERHQRFRECLAAGLAEGPDFEVVDKVASGKEALDRLDGQRVDVLLVALEPSPDGVRGLIREVEKRSPASKVVLLGRDEDEERVLDCLQAGAVGYLARDQPLPDLRAALRAVSQGDRVCSARVAHSLRERLARLGEERRRSARLDYLALSHRELEILTLLAEGCSNRQIADRLYLSIHTVKNHVHKILETLGVSSRWAAVRHAEERGWLGFEREDGTAGGFFEAPSGSTAVVSSLLAHLAALDGAGTEPPSAGSAEPLTVREREVLPLLAAGLANKEVGRRLRITEQTVKNHVHSILTKLQVHRRREAVRRAYDLGLLAEPRSVAARTAWL